MTIPRSTDRHVFSPDRYGGVIAPNGAVYGIPQTATGVLKISPGARRADGSVGEDAVTVVGEGTLGEGGWKWHGGVLVGTAIYAFPNNHDRVLKIDTERDALELLEAAGGRGKGPEGAGRPEVSGAILSKDVGDGSLGL